MNGFLYFFFDQLYVQIRFNFSMTSLYFALINIYPIVSHTCMPITALYLYLGGEVGDSTKNVLTVVLSVLYLFFTQTLVFICPSYSTLFMYRVSSVTLKSGFKLDFKQPALLHRAKSASHPIYCTKKNPENKKKMNVTCWLPLVQSICSLHSEIFST